MDSPQTIVLTGGGTAGHVIPNLALLPLLTKAGWRAEYIGSETGIEKRLVEAKGLPFHGIPSGKLRRYFDWKNFTDPFRVVAGVFKAWSLLGRIRPKVVFSKGGFVAVPVVFAARARGIPVIVHESDLTPGLANRLAIPFAKAVCASFPQTLQHLPPAKAVLTGAPIRAELFHGDRVKGEAFLGLLPQSAKSSATAAAAGIQVGQGTPGAQGTSGERISDPTGALSKDASGWKPLLLIVGGSLGSRNLNKAVRAVLPDLLAAYRVAHLCGKDGLDASLQGTAGYRQLEYVGEEMPDVLAAADMILSRAGSNAIFEFLALRKPHLLVPLPLASSRGDQILNAKAFEAEGYSRVLPEEEMGGGRLLTELQILAFRAEMYREAMSGSSYRDGAKKVMDVIARFA